jgi:undecaprenyl-diphosphatase
MTWWQAIILGLVEGLTEYLPISSTGHLILMSWLLGLEEGGTKQAVDSFGIVIQAGAIAAVLGLYRQRVRQMTLGLMGKDAAGLRLAMNLVIAFLPAAVLGLMFHGPIKDYLFHPWPVVGALFVGAWLMLAVAKSDQINKLEAHGKSLDSITWQIALMIGFAQCIAMWPGTSRSMMTIVAAILLGLRRKDAAEFSFLLGLITLSAATAYEGYSDGAQMLEQIDLSSVLIGFIVAAISAAVAVKWFVGFLTRHGLAPFGWYRVALAGILAALILSGVMG